MDLETLNTMEVDEVGVGPPWATPQRASSAVAKAAPKDILESSTSDDLDD